MKKRIFATVLLCTMLLTLILPLASCGEEKKPSGEKSTTASAVTTEPSNVREQLDNGLPELDYGGEKVTFLTPTRSRDDLASGSESAGVYTTEISAEELTNEPINDAIYNRNLKINEMLNVEVTEAHLSDHTDSVNNMVRKDIQSGNGDFDIVGNPLNVGVPLIFEGCYYDLRNNGLDDYINIKKPWWNDKWVEQAIVDDRLYCITGSLSLSLKRYLFVTYYNKTLAESLGIGDLYEVVDDGNWTIDYLTELSSSVYADLNGNSERDSEDRYGLLVNHYECVDMYWSAFDMEFLARTEDGWFRLTDNVEKISNTFDIVYALTYENNGTYDFIDSHGFGTANQIFADGNALFAFLYLSSAESTLFRNMQDDYGILPEPKYDARQKEYYSFAPDLYTVFYIPISSKDPARAAAVLEAMACESYNTVEVAYLDSTLKGRYSNDANTRRMIDLIVNGFKVDSGWVYGGDLGISSPPAAALRTIVYFKSQSFSSEFKKLERTVPIWCRSIKERLEKLDY